MSDENELNSNAILTKTFNFFYTFPGNLSVLLTDQFAIASSSGHYYLDFFQLQPPVGSEALVVDVEQRCVARLAFTPEVLARLQTELKRHQERYEASLNEVATES